MSLPCTHCGQELTMNPETLQFACAQGHQFTDAEVEAMTMAQSKKSSKKRVQQSDGVSDVEHGGNDLSIATRNSESAEDENKAELPTETVKIDAISAGAETETESSNANALAMIDEHGTSWTIGTDFTTSGDFQVVVLADGDQLIPVRVPQGYLESARQEAEAEEKTIVEWLSERVRESLENYFVAVQTV